MDILLTFDGEPLVCESGDMVTHDYQFPYSRFGDQDRVTVAAVPKDSTSSEVRAALGAWRPRKAPRRRASVSSETWVLELEGGRLRFRRTS
ncbi:MAG: hypothetical protein KJI72_02095 [Patescibacteria group bacterium]|nr:hypothetical protein [Patescibacteria group bacterium]